jgi:hypothetical protein
VLQSIRQGLPVPSRIADAPELLPWLRPVYNAFTELSTCRHDSGPIPWTAIQSYAEAYGYDNDEFELLRFTRLIRSMDRAYLEKAHEKQKRLSEKPKTKPSVGKGRK